MAVEMSTEGTTTHNDTAQITMTFDEVLRDQTVKYN